MTLKTLITALFLVIAFGVLIKLGVWQLQRLEWKNNIIADIQAQEDINTTETPLGLETAEEFERGYLDAQFNNDFILIKPRIHEGKVGAHAYSIITTIEGVNIPVNYGWIEGGENPTYNDLYPGRFIGYLKSPDRPNAFTPSNNTGQNQWYNYDENDFKRYYDTDEIYDKILYITETPISNAIPFSLGEAAYPRNKHAQYAAFWFFMAGLLPILVGLFMWSRRKNK
jgi:surfeit locus 1 family protein